MLNLRDDNYKLLYDLKVSKEHAVRISKLKKGEKPSIMSDAMFKTMFFHENRLKYSAKFLSYYLDVSFEELIKNIKLSKNELDKEKEDSKEYRSDYVASIGESRINIEVNNNSEEVTMQRNMDYAFKLYGSSVKRGRGKESYKYNQVIQFNLNNFSFVGNDKTVDIYTVKNEEGLRLTNNIIFIQIYIPNLRKKWYNRGIQSLSEEERYALGLVENDIMSSEELGGDISIMREYIKEAQEVMEDEYFGEAYDKEVALKEEYIKEGREEGRKEGKEEGRQEGKQEEKLEIAKALLKNNVDINIIINSTGLTEKDINTLIEE